MRIKYVPYIQQQMSLEIIILTQAPNKEYLTSLFIEENNVLTKSLHRERDGFESEISHKMWDDKGVLVKGKDEQYFGGTVRGVGKIVTKASLKPHH